MATSFTETAKLLREEKTLLIKADVDVEQGRERVRHQQTLLSEMQASGHHPEQAERLVTLLQQTLVEWERHRELIIQRIAILEQRLPGKGKQGPARSTIRAGG